MKVKNFWILLLCLLAGLTVGTFCGELLSQINALKFFSYSQEFGLEGPVSIHLGVLFISVQVRIQMTLAGVLGMIGGILIYKKI